MFVVIRCARLAEILEYPDLLITALNTGFEFDSREAAKRPEAIVWSRSSSMKHGIVRMRINRHDAPDVSMHGAIHRTVKRLVRLDATIEEPMGNRMPD